MPVSALVSISTRKSVALKWVRHLGARRAREQKKHVRPRAGQSLQTAEGGRWGAARTLGESRRPLSPAAARVGRPLPVDALALVLLVLVDERFALVQLHPLARGVARLRAGQGGRGVNVADSGAGNWLSGSAHRGETAKWEGQCFVPKHAALAKQMM